MILRFASISSAPEYVAFDTDSKVYTTRPEIVKLGAVVSVACNHFEHIMRELDFNCYDYSPNLSPVEPEEIPQF